jgi:hypothetical protein
MLLNQNIFENLLNKLIVQKHPKIKKLDSVVEFKTIGGYYYDVHFSISKELDCETQMEIDTSVKKLLRGLSIDPDNVKGRTFFKLKNGKYEFTCKGGYSH